MRNTHISLDSATKIEGVFEADNDKPQIVEHYEIARKKGLAPQTFLAQGLVLGDYVTTVWGMNKGAVEGNPLMPKSKSGQVLATAVKLGALTYIDRQIDTKYRDKVMFGVSVVSGYAIGSNTMIAVYRDNNKDAGAKAHLVGAATAVVAGLANRKLTKNFQEKYQLGLYYKKIAYTYKW